MPSARDIAKDDAAKPGDVASAIWVTMAVLGLRVGAARAHDRACGPSCRERETQRGGTWRRVTAGRRRGAEGVGYLVLGALLGALSERRASFGMFVAAGATIGATFGTAIVVVLTASTTREATAATVVPRAINDVLFPIRCAVVLYTSNVLAKRAAAA